MNKLYGVLLSLLIVIAGCAGSVQTPSESSPSVIRIGASLPLSGDTAFIGEAVRNGMEMALNDLGDTKYQYVLVFEDDQLNAKQAASAATKMISSDNVDSLVSVSSGTASVVAKIAQDNKVLHLAIASDQTIADGEYNYIHWTPPSEEAKVMVTELQRRKIKKVAIIEMNHNGIKAMVDASKAGFPSVGVEVVYDGFFNGGERDFKTILSQAKQKKPEIFLLVAFSPEIELIKKQMDELGITIPITGIESFALTDQPQIFEGNWFVNAAQATGDFTQRYQDKYSKAPALGAPNGYDVVRLFVEAYEKAGTDATQKPTKESVLAQMDQIKNFPGVLGSLTVGKEGVVNSPAIVQEIRNGKAVTVN